MPDLETIPKCNFLFQKLDKEKKRQKIDLLVQKITKYTDYSTEKKKSSFKYVVCTQRMVSPPFADYA
jgi:hypothetical protein